MSAATPGLAAGHTTWQDTVPLGTIDATMSGQTANTDMSGAIYGAQMGCDYQFNRAWVIGVEGSFSAGVCRAGSVMRGLRDVARISRAKGADVQAICAMKDGLRLAQSISRQAFDQIGFLGRFSRLSRADSRH